MKIVRALLLVALFVAPVAVWYLWPSDENRIRRLVRNEASALEAEDAEGFMKGISFNYSDKRGLSYLVIKRQLEREFAVREAMSVRVAVRDVRVTDGRASATVDARVSEGAAGGSYFGDRPVEIELKLVKDAALRWRIAGSAITRSDAGGLPPGLPARKE